MHLVERVAVALLLLVPAIALGKPLSDRRRAHRGNAWAHKNLAYIDASLVAEFDALMDVARRRHRWLLTGVVVALVLVPLPADWGLWPWAAGMWGMSAVLSSIFLIRWVTSAGPGPRVARARRVELTDYVSPKLRSLMWVSVAVLGCVTVFALVSPEGTGARVYLVVMVALLGGSAVGLEILGRALAGAPEPAVDAAHLYWQDVMRAEMVGSHARQVAFGATTAIGALWENGIWSAGPLVDILVAVIGMALLVCILISGFAQLDRPVDHVRARLWPRLGPYDIVGLTSRVTA